MRLVVGVGARRGVSTVEVIDMIDVVLAGVLAPGVSVRCLATVASRVTEPGIVAAAAWYGWPVVGYPPAELAEVEVPNPSAAVERALRTPSVAEAAALRSGGTLIVPKRVGARATVAVALLDDPSGAWRVRGEGRAGGMDAG